jgi:signal transduction histidine kinase/CheY-like chemotaxis protein
MPSPPPVIEAIELDTQAIQIPEEIQQSWQVSLDLIAEIFNTPAALIMRTWDDEIEVFSSSNTAGNVYQKGETASLNTGLYCEAVIETNKCLNIANALKDPAWCDNPDIELGMVAYLGFPLNWPNGDNFGTVCVLHNKEQQFSDLNTRALKQVQQSLELSLSQIYHNTLLTLSEKKLSEAHRQSELANQAKSRFLADMSHEIRTPLNAIIGMLELVNCSRLDREQKDMLSTTHDSALGLLNVINDVLDFSQIEAGHLQIENAPYNIHKLVNNIVNILQVSASKSSVLLSQDICCDQNMHILGDSHRTRQVLYNLVGNAIKFTGIKNQPKPEVHVKVHCDRARQQIVITISDNGIGMSPQAVEQVFRPFTQSGDNKSKMLGTGLGLNICWKLVDMMGGEIHIDSKLGKGSCFTVTLPMVVAEDIEVPSQELEQPTRSANILIVEDNIINQTVLQKQLQQLGHRSKTAANGAIALEMLAQSCYDLVLTDCQMPEMDGYEMTQAIRAKDELAELPIVAITASVVKEDLDRCYQVGMNSHLTKPLRLEQLQEKIQQYLHGPLA